MSKNKTSKRIEEMDDALQQGLLDAVVNAGHNSNQNMKAIEAMELWQEGCAEPMLGVIETIESSFEKAD